MLLVTITTIISIVVCLIGFFTPQYNSDFESWEKIKHLNGKEKIEHFITKSLLFFPILISIFIYTIASERNHLEGLQIYEALILSIILLLLIILALFICGIHSTDDIKKILNKLLKRSKKEKQDTIETKEITSIWIEMETENKQVIKYRFLVKFDIFDQKLYEKPKDICDNHLCYVIQKDIEKKLFETKIKFTNKPVFNVFSDYDINKLKVDQLGVKIKRIKYCVVQSQNKIQNNDKK